MFISGGLLIPPRFGSFDHTFLMLSQNSPLVVYQRKKIHLPLGTCEFSSGMSINSPEKPRQTFVLSRRWKQGFGRFIGPQVWSDRKRRGVNTWKPSASFNWRVCLLWIVCTTFCDDVSLREEILAREIAYCEESPAVCKRPSKRKKTLLTLYWFFFCSLPLISALLFSLLAKCLFHRESAHKSLFFRKQWNCPRGAFFYLYIFPRHVPALDTRNLITRYHTRGARLPPCPRLCNLKQSSGMTCLL